MLVRAVSSGIRDARILTSSQGLHRSDPRESKRAAERGILAEDNAVDSHSGIEGYVPQGEESSATKHEKKQDACEIAAF